jgi:hypothetical protein
MPPGQVERVERARKKEYDRQVEAHQTKLFLKNRSNETTVVFKPPRKTSKTSKAARHDSASSSMMDFASDEEEEHAPSIKVSQLLRNVEGVKEKKAERKKQELIATKERLFKPKVAAPRRSRQPKPHVELNSSLDVILAKVGGWLGGLVYPCGVWRVQVQVHRDHVWQQQAEGHLLNSLFISYF